jgi:type IV pilus assembly protein PilM
MSFIRDRLFNIARSGNEIIGLDIGCSAVKCVVLELVNTKLAYRFKNHGIEKLPSGAIENFQIKAHALLATSIKRLLAQATVYSRHCVIGLPDIIVNSKWVLIDVSARENLEIAVNLAVAEHIPYPLDAIYFDYQVYEFSQENENHLNVLIVACRKEHVDACLDIVHQANLIPLAIEVSSQALVRAYFHFYPQDSLTTCMLIDIGVAQWSLLFLDENKKLCTYSEKIVSSSREELLQYLKHTINTICLSFPYITFSKIFFIGADFTLLAFITQKLNGFYGISTEIIGNDLFVETEKLNKEFTVNFPALFLSYGLALRGSGLI